MGSTRPGGIEPNPRHTRTSWSRVFPPCARARALVSERRGPGEWGHTWRSCSPPHRIAHAPARAAAALEERFAARRHRSPAHAPASPRPQNHATRWTLTSQPPKPPIHADRVPRGVWWEGGVGFRQGSRLRGRGFGKARESRLRERGFGGVGAQRRVPGRVTTCK